MSWIYYLLEANLYLILFYGVYRFFLNKETFYKLNRYFLMAGSLLSFLFPFVQLGFLKKNDINTVNLGAIVNETQYHNNNKIQFAEVKEEFLTLNNIIFGLYTLIAFLLALKTIFDIIKILKMRSQPIVNYQNDIKIIELENSKAAFSFFNLLFIDPKLPNRSIIVKHELVHIKQKHSIDIVFFEIIRILNWFNPIVYILKNEIKLLHEYLADEETANTEIEKYDYALFLIQNSVGLQNLKLTNQIFGSSILKKRISMLTQNKSAQWARLKMLLVLPLICGMLCLSTMSFTKAYGILDLYPAETVLQTKIRHKSVNQDDKKSFYPKNSYSAKTNKPVQIEQRYIIINGKPVENNSTFYGAKNAKTINFLSDIEAIKKYGKEKGKNGAVEISGDEIQYMEKVQPPPLRDPNSPNIVMLGPPPTISTVKIKTEKYPNPTAAKNIQLNRNKSEKFILADMGNGRKSLQVFNLEGGRVYSTFNYQNDWDGKLTNLIRLKNKQIPAGKYAYVVLITNKNDEPNEAKKGYLTII